jgi:ankyrin repeat protein
MANKQEILDAIEESFIRERTLSVNRESPRNGTTPLHTLASLPPSKRSMEYASELIKMGAEVNITCFEERTPTSYAIVSGNYEVLKYYFLIVH